MRHISEQHKASKRRRALHTWTSISVVMAAALTTGCGQEERQLAESQEAAVARNRIRYHGHFNEAGVFISSSPEYSFGWASFYEDVFEPCVTVELDQACSLRRCQQGLREPRPELNAGTVTIRGTTVPIDYPFSEGTYGLFFEEYPAFQEGAELTFAVPGQPEGPSFRRELPAPSPADLISPVISEEGPPPKIRRDRPLHVAWVPGRFGKASFDISTKMDLEIGVNLPAFALFCDWPASDGMANIPVQYLQLLPPGDYGASFDLVSTYKGLEDGFQTKVFAASRGPGGYLKLK